MKSKDPTSELYLIEKVKAGDLHAFRELVESYKDIALTLAYSILKDRSVSEDVLQEVFIKVYHKIGGLRASTSFSSWLYRIVVNTSYNELKKRKPAAYLSEVSDEFVEEAPGSDMSEKQDQQKYIQLAMLRLRADEALVLRLFYLCEMNIPEIAKITGFRKSKIKVDLHRGRQNLGHELKQLLGIESGNLL